MTVWGQPFVLRSESPVSTVGGGCVLDPDAERIRKVDGEVLEWVQRLASSEEIARASAALYFAGLRDWRPSDLPRTAGVEAIEAAQDALRTQGELREIPVSPTRTFRVHRQVFDRLCERIETALRKLHERFPLRSVFERAQLAHGFRYLKDEAIVAAALRLLELRGKVQGNGRGIALADHGPRLSQNERKLLAGLIETFRQAGIQTPGVQECQGQATRNQESVPQLLALAVENGDLVAIAPDYYLHTDVERSARALS